MRFLALLLLVAACSRSPGESRPVARDANSAAPSPPPAGPVVRQWKLELSTQFFGTALGPLNEIAIASDGAITVKQDHRVIGSGTLPVSQLESLSRLLADPKLAAAQAPDPGPGMGQHTTIKVTGDVTLGLVGPSPATGPVIVEVDRLRDLVAPPEDFKLALSAAPDQIRLSSNGYIEILRNGARIATFFYPVESLAALRKLLAARELRAATSPGGDKARLTATGDLSLDLRFPGAIEGPARPVADEMRRLARLVEAAQTPPRSFAVIYERQLHGAGLGPKRTITIDSSDRSLVLQEEGKKSVRRTVPEAELAGLARLLVDPSFRSAETTSPPSEGMHFHLLITGDQPFEVTYRVAVPPKALEVINRIDWLSGRDGP